MSTGEADFLLLGVNIAGYSNEEPIWLSISNVVEKDLIGRLKCTVSYQDRADPAIRMQLRQLGFMKGRSRKSIQ